jgi:hypothetical protein
MEEGRRSWTTTRRQVQSGLRGTVPRLSLPFSLPPAVVPRVVTTRHMLFVSCPARQSHPVGIKSSSSGAREGEGEWSGHGKIGRRGALRSWQTAMMRSMEMEFCQGSEEARASKGGWAPMSRTRIPACNSVASIGPFLSALVGLHARDDCVTAVISREQ